MMRGILWVIASQARDARHATNACDLTRNYREFDRPFIDARVELYGDGMLSLYDKLRSGDREAVEDALKRYGIALTIFAPDNRIVAALDREPGWRRLYADATAVIHVRDGAPEAEGDEGNDGADRLARTFARDRLFSMR